MENSMSDLLPFLRAWVSDPMRVAAISPSGSALTELMTREVNPEDGPVLELGPGTGVFTRGLLARGLNQNDLTLIEAGRNIGNPLSPGQSHLHGCNPAWQSQPVSREKSRQRR
jgi:phospholipid N-methyltransferase